MREVHESEERLQQFVRSLYFDLQRIDQVKPLEIWNGVRELRDPFEKTGLVKNLYKVAVPLANVECFGRPFEEHGRVVRRAVEASASWLAEDSEGRFFQRFPDPPVGEESQKELYRLVKDQVRAAVAQAVAGEREGTASRLTPRAGHGTAPRAGHGTVEPPRAGADSGADGRAEGAAPRQRDETPGRQPLLNEEPFPDGLFDFREMRIVDNEFPYIIFTDKEFRVIHGLAYTYMWLIDVDSAFTATLESLGVGSGIPEEYRRFVRRVHRENPLTISGRKMSAAELIEHIREKIKYEDYLDVFEKVYRWFEAAQAKLGRANA